MRFGSFASIGTSLLDKDRRASAAVTTARFQVERVGPFVSFQDRGRHGSLRFGVPASGPMDRLAHATANLVVGNEQPTTAIEVSLAGMTLECVAGSATVAIAGGGFTVTAPGPWRDPWLVTTVGVGDRLVLEPGEWGSWTYVAFAGELTAPRWLGSTSTHAPSGFGGGMLRVGQELTVDGARCERERDGPIPIPEFARPPDVVSVVLGPQRHRFVDDATTNLLDGRYHLTEAYDRMGVRLSGPALVLDDALAIPSEPVVRGSIQVAGDGVPTVLLADHQTTGGYPKIATVVSSELDRFTQRRAGDPIRFSAVTPAAAIELARARAAESARYLDTIVEPARTLDQRLMQHNLIGDADFLLDPPP